MIKCYSNVKLLLNFVNAYFHLYTYLVMNWGKIVYGPVCSSHL